MQSASINFNSQQFFQPDVAELDITTEVLEHRELARLVRRLEDDHIKPEGTSKTVCEVRIESAALIKQAHAFRAFPCLYDQLQCPRIQPPSTLVYQAIHDLGLECSCVFLPKLELHLEPAPMSRADYIPRFRMKLCETFPAFDPCHTEVGTQIQVSF